MLLKTILFFNLLTTVGSWGWSYYEGNTCCPTAQCAALCRLPSACGTQEKKANPSHPAHRSTLPTPDPGAGPSHMAVINPNEIPPKENK